MGPLEREALLPARTRGRGFPARRAAALLACLLSLGAFAPADDGADDGAEPTPLGAKLRARVERAIEAGELPGAVVVAGVVEGAGERRLAFEVVGRRALEPEAEPLDAETLFDLGRADRSSKVAVWGGSGGEGA